MLSTFGVKKLSFGAFGLRWKKLFTKVLRTVQFSG